MPLSPGGSRGRIGSMQPSGPRAAAAFAPSAITNFFEISYAPSDGASGATGGGYVLSRGTTSRAELAGGKPGVSTVVNMDAGYDARTTKRAVSLLLAGEGRSEASVNLEQVVDTPIGAGFGASAAAATSAVYAVAAAAGIEKPKRELALWAYRAEVMEQTGLGTVSVVYDSAGAGAITVPGEPGASRFVAVDVPPGTKIVTAFIAPFDKKDALYSKPVSERINSLGHAALQAFLADPTLDTLATEGERFSRGLGLESQEVKKLVSAAKGAGAKYASQNMIGYSVHCVADEDAAPGVASALREFGPAVRVDVFEVGSRAAGTLRPSRR